MDDYSPQNFRLVTCDDFNNTLKCDNGQCYNITTLTGSIADCSTNQSYLNPVGWWNPSFPSQDYWKY